MLRSTLLLWSFVLLVLPGCAMPTPGQVAEQERQLREYRAQANRADAPAVRPRSEPAAERAGGGLSQTDAERIARAAVERYVQTNSPKTAPHAEAASDIDTPSYHGRERPDDFALIIGIGKYRDIPEAQYAERDAATVKKHLLAMGYPERNVVLLTGDRATRTGLVKNLETWLPRNVNEKSTFFFYYSGHGAPDAASGQAYLVPYDGDPQYLEDTGYPMKRLYEKLGALKAKQVIVALDSCFSGAGGRSVLAKGTRPLISKIDLGQEGAKNIVSLTASASDQISGTMDEQGHGAFTYYLLRGLNGEASDGKDGVTVQSLYKYLLPNVQDYAHRNNREQIPQLVAGAGSQAEIRIR